MVFIMVWICNDLMFNWYKEIKWVFSFKLTHPTWLSFYSAHNEFLTKIDFGILKNFSRTHRFIKIRMISIPFWTNFCNAKKYSHHSFSLAKNWGEPPSIAYTNYNNRIVRFWYAYTHFCGEQEYCSNLHMHWNGFSFKRNRSMVTTHTMHLSVHKERNPNKSIELIYSTTRVKIHTHKSFRVHVIRFCSTNHFEMQTIFFPLHRNMPVDMRYRLNWQCQSEWNGGCISF